MTYRTAYCTDATCRSIRIIQDNGRTIFSIPSPTDPTYLNLLLYAEIPFAFIPVSQFFCDPRLLTRGKILTTNEFLTQCNTTTGELLISPPSITYNWIVAYTLNNSDNIIAYTTDNQKFTLDPVDDALLFAELNNYSDFLFGGKVLTEFEANIYNVDERYFDFEDFDEEENIVIEYNIEDLAPFTISTESQTTDVDSGFEDFLQLSSAIVNAYYNGFNDPPEVSPQLLRDTSLSTVWSQWLNNVAIENFNLIKDELQKESE